MNRKRILAAACVLIGWVATPAGADVWFQGLGDRPGGGFLSWATDVSADGSVIVGESRVENGTEAFRWTKDGGMTGLGYLSGGDGSGARSISADGTTIVGYSRVSGGYEAFSWKDGVMTGLGQIYSTPGTFAEAVSGDGSVVVGDANGLEAFRWENGQMQGLGDYSGGLMQSRALDISADGNTVVGYGHDGEGRPFIWTQNEGMQLLGGWPEDSSGFAEAISPNGQFVVGLRSTSAFIWDQMNGTRYLGNIDGMTMIGAKPHGVTDSGIVVGGLTYPEYMAFIWDDTKGMRLLQDVLTTEYGLNLSGWKLQSAESISNDGHTIVGYGINPQGNTEAWVVHLPEPAGVLLMVPAVAACFRRRR